MIIDEKTDFDKVSKKPVDAVITNLKGVGVGILTADCSLHAGWKGALTGICENALTSLRDLGVDIKKISVAIGPTISSKCYEVKSDFFETFIKTDPYFEHFFIKKDGNYFFNLPLFIESRFNLFGVYDIHNLGLCTYENSELFYSNRRAYHKSEKDFGRMASIISL